MFHARCFGVNVTARRLDLLGSMIHRLKKISGYTHDHVQKQLFQAAIKNLFKNLLSPISQKKLIVLALCRFGFKVTDISLQHCSQNFDRSILPFVFSKHYIDGIKQMPNTCQDSAFCKV